MTRKEAWLKLINTDGIEKQLGFSANTVYNYRHRANKQGYFPIDHKMREMLEKAGWKIAREEQWVSPKGYILPGGNVAEPNELFAQEDKKTVPVKIKK